MHLALWQLLWLDLKGSLRGLANIRRSWRQIILFCLVVLFLGFFLWLRTQGQSDGVAEGRFGAGMPFWTLIYLSLTWLTSSADRGLVMRPAEIHFIAGGPFRATDVITLNLVRLAIRAFLGGAVLALLATAYLPNYGSALVGMWLVISVSLLVGMIASLAARSTHGNFVKRSRRIFNVLAILVLVSIVWQAMNSVRMSGETPRMASVAAAAIETRLGSWVLPPLEWMFSPLRAESFFGQTLPMLPLRLLVVAGLVGMIYLLGGRYLEASTQRTDLSIAKRQNALRSGVGGAASTRSWTSRVSIPAFPRLAGAGAVAWVQVIHSIRVLPKFLVFTVAIVAVVLVIPMSVDPENLQSWGLVAWMLSLTTYADFLLLLQLPVGFLGPVSQREMLKSLPLNSVQVVLGQLAGPVVPLMIIHASVTLLFLWLAPSEWQMVLTLSLALIPVALVLIANVNLLGAWNIIRPRALQQRDILAAGRAMASVWIFFAMLLPTMILGSIFGVVASVFTASATIILFAVSLGVALSSLIYIGLCAWTFSRWQPAVGEGGLEEVDHDH